MTIAQLMSKLASYEGQGTVVIALKDGETTQYVGCDVSEFRDQSGEIDTLGGVVLTPTDELITEF